MLRRSASRRLSHSSQSLPWMRLVELERALFYVSRGLLMCLLLAGAWRATAYLTSPGSFPIRHVVVEGELNHLDRDTLRLTIDAVVTEGFFGIKLLQVQQSLESVPWVYRASVRRQWPDKVAIRIEEQTPIARWGETALLNRYGEVFEAKGYEKPLPLIEGGAGREKVLIEAFLKTDALLRTVGLGLVTLREDARHDQRLELDNGIRMALGRRDQEERLRRFITAYNHTLEGVVERIEELDLRYTNGFSVGWKSEGLDLLGS